MTIDQAIYILRNTAWLGSNDERDETEQAVETVVNELERRSWIPCSERLPDTNGVYNVTRKISDGFVCRNISDTCYYDGSNTWHDDTRVNHERRYITDVIAWMPMPEPYGGEQE